MSDAGKPPTPTDRLADLSRKAGANGSAAGSKSSRARPPLHLWNPPDYGQIPIEIRRDGSWWHEGAPIRRARLVALFASILRREGDRYYLVTPGEKYQIHIEDVPFIAVEVSRRGEGRAQQLEFRTDLDDLVVADSAHPIRVVTDMETGEPRPYVMVRDGLEARINRPTFYELVDLGIEQGVDGKVLFGVWSSETFFELGAL